jgi:hypothetical protein
MKTVYLLKNSPKSFKVLLKLVKMGDITTNIIIVDRFYSKILRQDARVKEFPFIINTLPTARGLIPKIAKVLPFRVYIKIINANKHIYKRDYNMRNFNKTNFNKTNFNKTNLNKTNFNKSRIIIYNPPLRNKNSVFNGPKITLKKCNIKKPTIKAVKQKDKSVNIILYNN